MKVRLAALAMSAAVLLGACSSEGDLGAADDAAGAAGGATTTWATTSSTTSTTEAPTTTTTTEPVDGLAPGMKGPEVEEMQQRLAGLGYDAGPVDGKYGYLTAQAVMAFQKVEGLERTGRATTAVLDRMDAAPSPAAHVASGEPTRVEVHLPTQTMQVWLGGERRGVYNVSTGTGKRYAEAGGSGIAVTPTGRYTITRRIDGWRDAPLGMLYNPLYFNGGIAIHGSHSVPAYPASHGCVRVNMAAAELLPDLLANGTPVYVVGDEAVSAPAPPPEPTTTTAAPPTTEAPTTTAAPTSTTAPAAEPAP